MSMVEKNTSQNEKQNSLIKPLINFEGYSCDSIATGNLTQRHLLEEQESSEEVESIRLALIEGEESIEREGYSNRSVDEIFDAALNKYLTRNG